MIDFGREICGDLNIAGKREWLVTNGIGGYACGTIAGLLTRSYHGLLVAALEPPLGRTLLVTKIDESTSYNGRSFPLFCNRWASGQVEPLGFINLERFHLDGSTPVWTFACAEVLLEKRVWMLPYRNTTYIQYHLARPSFRQEQTAAEFLHLELKILVNYRDHHAVTRSEGKPQIRVDRVRHGLSMQPAGMHRPFYLVGDVNGPAFRATSAAEWYADYYLSMEAYRGQEAVDDHLYAGTFQVDLQPGQTFTLIATAESLGTGLQENEPELPDLPDAGSAAQNRRKHEASLLASAHQSGSPPDPALDQLVLAADQFIVRRSSTNEPNGSTVIAGYPWFGDWGRDTMISLPGLALATGRPELARSLLRTFAGYIDQGMLPNRFPDEGQVPEYNTADATLWYFEALRAYLQVTDDQSLLQELFPALQEVIAWHQRGTRYQVHVDPQDGLLYAGESGVQLTWMDAKVEDWVVTPRIGKPVEINALWYNALCCMRDFAGLLGQSSESYAHAAAETHDGFHRFWNPVHNYCFDVLDGPQGNEAALRPNQILAVALCHSPLTGDQQRAVVTACASQLLTSYGLRSLGPEEAGYIGTYEGSRIKRDGAYHQGTVWAWLIGPFIRGHLRVYHETETARSYLQPLLQHLNDHGIGTISEIFDGNPPFTPRGCFAQAWSVAEVLYTLQEIRLWDTNANLSTGARNDKNP